MITISIFEGTNTTATCRDILASWNDEFFLNYLNSVTQRIFGKTSLYLSYLSNILTQESWTVSNSTTYEFLQFFEKGLRRWKTRLFIIIWTLCALKRKSSNFNKLTWKFVGMLHGMMNNECETRAIIQFQSEYWKK